MIFKLFIKYVIFLWLNFIINFFLKFFDLKYFSFEQFF